MSLYSFLPSLAASTMQTAASSGSVTVGSSPLGSIGLLVVGVVEGTSGADRIDSSYAGDPEGDLVTDNADIIQAGGGRDTIVSSGGEDTIDGGAGRDTYEVSSAPPNGRSYMFVGESSRDDTGFSVSSAGDVDGDGREDFLIGAPALNSGGPASGTAYLILGQDLAALDAADGDVDGEIDLGRVAATGGSYRFVGESPSGGDITGVFGEAVSSAGDVDGDGLGDFLIGGGGSGITGVGSSFLITAADLADLDALDGSIDGEIDLALVAGTGGTYKFDENVFDGTSEGARLSSAGDVDGDGRDDLLLGSRSGGSRAFLISSADLAAIDALDGTVDGEIDHDFIASGTNSYQFNSTGGLREVSAIGNVDGDSLSDFAIGSSGTSVFLLTAGDLASFDALDGSTDGQIDLTLIAGTGGAYEFVNAGSGADVSSAGDVDSDGLQDLLIGSGGGTTTYLIAAADLASLDALDGSTDGEIDLSLVPGTGQSYAFVGSDGATRVSSAGDIDGDGRADLLIGDPSADSNGTNSGDVYLITSADLAALDALDGNTDGEIDLSLVAGVGGVYQFSGEGAMFTAGDEAGFSVASAGDVDNDGVGDLLIGAPSESFVGGSAAPGEVFLISGADLATLDGLDGSIDGDIDLTLVAAAQNATVVAVNNDGDGTAVTNGAADTLTSVEDFTAQEGDAIDVITITDAGTPFTAADVNNLSDNSVGTFTPSAGGSPISFGPSEANQLSDILALDQAGDIQITGGDDAGRVGNISFRNFETINFSIVCFCTGTRIATRTGEVSIEDLSVGDTVVTLDHGQQEIRWIGSTTLDAIDLAAKPKLRPVRIRAGALGQDLPVRDLLVSPQHRVLVNSAIAERMFGAREVLIPAIKLVELDGIEQVTDVTEVTYWHMLFDTHEVIFSEGAPTESLFTGPEALKGVSAEAREEILALFPDLVTTGTQPIPIRPIPQKGRFMKQLVARHHKNNQPLLMAAV